MEEARRRSPRLPFRLPVTIRSRTHRAPGQTLNISRFGISVECQLDAGVGDHVWVLIQLPDGLTVDVTGVVRAAGHHIGIEFVMMSAKARRVWGEFMDSAEAEDSHGAIVSELPDRRMHDRHAMAIIIWIPTHKGPQQALSRDISAGGMFVDVPDPVDPSAELELLIVHPDTQEGFPILARVVRSDGRGPDQRGVALRFTNLTPATEEELLKFIGRTPQRDEGPWW